MGERWPVLRDLYKVRQAPGRQKTAYLYSFKRVTLSHEGISFGDDAGLFGKTRGLE